MCWVRRDEHVERIELCLFQHGGRRTSYSARLYKFSRSFVLFHTQILFVPSNEINVYLNKLVNNLHIISLHKLHNKLSCESHSSSRVCRAVLFDKLDTARMHGLYPVNCGELTVWWVRPNCITQVLLNKQHKLKADVLFTLLPYYHIRNYTILLFTGRSIPPRMCQDGSRRCCDDRCLVEW